MFAGAFKTTVGDRVVDVEDVEDVEVVLVE